MQPVSSLTYQGAPWTLDKYIRHIPGFPREGILFHDIMPLLQDAGGAQERRGLVGGVREEQADRPGAGR